MLMSAAPCAKRLFVARPSASTPASASSAAARSPCATYTRARPVRRFRLAGGVRYAPVELPAPAVVGDRCRKLSQQIEHVPCADEGRRDG